MELQVGVKILLKGENGKYLLLRRSPEKYPGVKGIWDIPGGRIKPGTSLMENLEREIREEVGLTLTGKPRLIGAQDIIRQGERHVVRLTYIGEAEGTPKLGEEHTEFLWCSLEEIKQRNDLDPYLKEILESASF